MVGGRAALAALRWWGGIGVCHHCFAPLPHTVREQVSIVSFPSRWSGVPPPDRYFILKPSSLSFLPSLPLPLPLFRTHSDSRIPHTVPICNAF